MEKISELTNELIDTEEEKLDVIKEANQLKIDAETTYNDLRQQCDVLLERDNGHKSIIETLETEVKRLTLHNEELSQEVKVFIKMSKRRMRNKHSERPIERFTMIFWFIFGWDF